MGGTHYVHVASDAELQKLWGMSERELGKLTKRNGFPRPVDPPEDESGVWRSIPALRDWLAATDYRKPRQLTLDWWPNAGEPAEFDGAQRITPRYGRRDVVAQHWATESGRLVVFWHDDPAMVQGGELARMEPMADVYVLVGWDWGIRGPALWCWSGQDPDAERVEVSWSDLARVLGQPAPYWPGRLRSPDLITDWQPGDAPARDVGMQDLDVFPLTRMALQYPPEHVAHRALIHTAQLIDRNTEAADSTDLQILQERLDRGSITPDEIVLAALPAEPVTDERPDPLEETVLHAGWREVLDRSDRLAEQCVRTLMAWDGGRSLPWSQTLLIPHSPARAEWLDRLEPAPERTAIYAGLERSPSQRGVAMYDPITDIPVLLPDEPGEEVRALSSRRLPATSPLAEIILEQEIWVRTQDGTLYPAPLHSYGGLSWGYGGTGPRTLATLAHRLLKDITAPAPTVGDGHATPDGLVELFTYDWASGTVITRQQLEQAC
ncbi:hypothetical protein FHS23_004590 [Prauserella isguenensis]|uniref:Uncharacterized protein n=1 Tax=Prauserella isguenensis TaxID=1470180 RepID=A0A839S6W9_9PSEU|nr:hypothetical protein [Prauserella isguenensis]MBB3053536.1 hypothetical protein [Prauserella isguenensis]